MKKNIKIVLIILLLVLTLAVIAFVQPNEENSENNEEVSENNTEKTMEEFIQCLVEEGMVVYASRTCPACSSLAEEFGGYDKVDSLFVECNEEQGRCMEEMKTNYVPEIQIQGEPYEGPRDLESLGQEVNCKL